MFVDLLFHGAATGDLDAVKLALARGVNVDARFPNKVISGPQYQGLTALAIACWTGIDAIETIEHLLANGADVNARNAVSGNASVMIMAAQGSATFSNYEKDSSRVFDALVSNGAKPDDGFANGKTPAFVCVNEYDSAISNSGLSTLLKLGADPNAVWNLGNYKKTLLWHVCWSAWQADNVKAIEVVVRAGAEVNPVVDRLDELPLVAVLRNQRCVEYLISCGATTSVLDKDGTSLMEYVKDKCSDSVYESLRKVG